MLAHPEVDLDQAGCTGPTVTPTTGGAVPPPLVTPRSGATLS